MENFLEFKIEQFKRLVVKTIGTTSSAGLHQYDLDKSETEESIYKRVFELEEIFKARRNILGSESDEIIINYSVINMEKLSDNRSVFGYQDITSEKKLEEFIPKTYVFGVILDTDAILEVINSTILSERQEEVLKNYLPFRLDGGNENEFPQVIMIKTNNDILFEEFLEDYRISLFES